jgi:hypothetical protein
LRAPPVPSNESDGLGGAGELGPTHKRAVLRPSRGGSLFLARPVAALACRPAIGGLAGPGRQTQFLREREPHISLLWGASCRNRRPDESGAGILPAWTREAGRMPAPLSSRQGCVCFQNFLQSNSHSRLMPVPEVPCLASQKLSPTERSREPFPSKAYKSCMQSCIRIFHRFER